MLAVFSTLHRIVTHCSRDPRWRGWVWIPETWAGSLKQENSGLVKLSCFLFNVAAFLFLLCHLHLWFAQHFPFRWCDLYFGHIYSWEASSVGDVTSAAMQKSHYSTVPQKPVLPVKFSSQPVVLESDPKLGLLVCPLLTPATIIFGDMVCSDVSTPWGVCLRSILSSDKSLVRAASIWWVLAICQSRY